MKDKDLFKLSENISERQLLLNAVELCLKHSKDQKDYHAKFKETLHWLRVLSMIPKFEQTVDF